MQDLRGTGGQLTLRTNRGTWKKEWQINCPREWQNHTFDKYIYPSMEDIFVSEREIREDDRCMINHGKDILTFFSKESYICLWLSYYIIQPWCHISSGLSWPIHMFIELSLCTHSNADAMTRVTRVRKAQLKRFVVSPFVNQLNHSKDLLPH